MDCSYCLTDMHHNTTSMYGYVHDFTESACQVMGMYMYIHEKNCHGGARQASDPWTAAVSSLLALISREYTYNVTCPAHHPVYIHVYTQIIITVICTCIYISSSYIKLESLIQAPPLLHMHMLKLHSQGREAC